MAIVKRILMTMMTIFHKKMLIRDRKFGIFKIASYICTVITSVTGLNTEFSIDSNKSIHEQLYTIQQRNYPYLAPSLLDRDFRIL